MFKKINQTILKKLKDIVGAEYLLDTRERLEDYGHDETPNLFAYPEAVVKPGNAEDVSELVELANRENFPVVARGAGTGVTGGAVAIQGGVVISLERMNRILEIDEANMMAVVEPGVITGNLHAEVEEKGLFYPPDPASLADCTLGGNLAEDAGGPRAVKYGVTRNYITGVQAVLPTGEIIEYGGKLAKNVTGYNLLHLLIGSEGTLGIATRITIRLLSKPKLRVDLLVPFPSYFEAVKCVSEILRHRLDPTVIEFMDQKCLEISRQVMEGGIPFDKAAAHLLIEVDGDDPDKVEAEYEAIGEICLERGASDVKVADSLKYQEQIWETRRKLRECIKIVSPIKVSEDVVVPRMEIAALLMGIDEIEKRHGIEILAYGHAGDGNVHVNFLKRDRDEEDWRQSLKKAIREVFALTVSLGGTISGEHGIGVTKKDHLDLALNPAAIKAMRQIKQALDPKNILNPGKIFPTEKF
ncbi:MAG: FAD-binding oxidoreductase [Candidatus Auribacterota bacterium]|nr:FAD-binding oxidoreductase [Candidatus Auribacterota bacterium]